MRELLPELDKWLAGREKIAVATVLQTWGSSPRGVGAKMALTPSGKIAGSVSGGCVENAVYEAGVEVIESGQAQLLHFGVADETAWNVGLACGGQIEVFVQRLDESTYPALREAWSSGKRFAVATVIRGPQGLPGCEILVPEEGEISGPLPPGLDEGLVDKARQVLAGGRSDRILAQTGAGQEAEVFVEVVAPQAVLVVVGGAHSAIALTSLAKIIGFRTVVVDPRRAFGNLERFPHVDRLVQAWPEEAFAQIELTRDTAVAMLTHDPKIDDPALIIALRSPAFYIGVLGSQSTQAEIRERLLQAGVSQDQLARLHGPIGLKIGSRTPEEIALSVLAEIVAVRNRVVG